MKKLATLFAMIVVGLGTALAQGTIDFRNSNTFPLQVKDAAGNVTTVGSSTGPLGPASVRVGLFIATTPVTSILQMTMVGLTTNSPSTLPLFVGTFNGNSPFPVPGHPAAEVVSFAFAAWSITTGALTYQAALTAPTGYIGTSAIGQNYALGGAAPPAITFGTGPGQIQGFTLNPVPEPSTIALGLLGAAALFLRRRK